jgi:hypothetical protein
MGSEVGGSVDLDVGCAELTDVGSDLDSIGASVTGASVTGESVGSPEAGGSVGLNEGSPLGLHTLMYLQAEYAS